VVQQAPAFFSKTILASFQRLLPAGPLRWSHPFALASPYAAAPGSRPASPRRAPGRAPAGGWSLEPSLHDSPLPPGCLNLRQHLPSSKPFEPADAFLILSLYVLYILEDEPNATVTDTSRVISPLTCGGDGQLGPFWAGWALPTVARSRIKRSSTAASLACRAGSSTRSATSRCHRTRAFDLAREGARHEAHCCRSRRSTRES
jgi:hypothetical protein